MAGTTNLIRGSGLMLIAAGLLYLPLPILDGWQGIADIGGSNWWIVYLAATIHHFFLLFGLFGLFAAQLDSAGILGLAGFVIASLGNALMAGIGTVQVTILPVLAGNPDGESALICTPFYPAATEAARGFIERACSEWGFDVLEMWTGISWLTFMVGVIVIGIAIARAGVLPRAAGILLAAGWLLQLAGIALPLPQLVEDASFLAVAGAYIWCGAALWRIRR